MDLEEARQALSKRVAFPWKRVAFLGVAGLFLVAGIALRAGLFSGEPDTEQTAPVEIAAPPPAPPAPAVDAAESVPKSPPPAPETATAPVAPAPPPAATVEPAEPPAPAVEQTEQAEPSAQPAELLQQAEQPEHPDAGMILIARQPVAMLASPSADAKAMYGFPAGRPFRVIGREGNFTKIKDMRSGATGWIDTAALAPPPPQPAVSTPSQTRPVSRTPAGASAEPKPKPAVKKGGQVAAESEPSPAPDQGQTRERPGVLFGRGGFFGGIFGGGN